MHKTSCGGVEGTVTSSTVSVTSFQHKFQYLTVPEFFHNPNCPTVQSTDHIMGSIVFVYALPVHQPLGILALSLRSTVRNQTYLAWCIT